MESKPGLYLHIGKPKCASTFLQKNIFPFSEHYFIGKKWNYSINKFYKAEKGTFNYNIIKKALLPGGLNNIDSNLIEECRNFKRNRDIILSEELCMSAIVFHCQDSIVNFFNSQTQNTFERELFEQGYNWGLKIGQNKELLSTYDPVLIINRLCSLFDREPKSILIIDREYTSWFISLFTQFRDFQKRKIKDRIESKIISNESDYNEKTLFGLGGFTLGVEHSAYRSDRSYGLSCENTRKRLLTENPQLSFNKIIHNKNPSTFFQNINENLDNSWQISGLKGKDIVTKTNMSIMEGIPSRIKYLECVESLDQLIKEYQKNI